MDLPQIITLITALGAGGIITAIIAAIRDRHKDKAAASKTMAEREEILSRITQVRIEESNKMIDRAWEIADRTDADLKETREEIRRLQHEINDLRTKLSEREKENELLKLELKKFLPNGRPPRSAGERH